MESNIKKCSNKEHETINAVYFCSQCKLYKCENFHSQLFQNHNCQKLDKDSNEIFIEICQLKDHNNDPLEFFCKTHNQLCCSSCLCPIKQKGKGQHKDCEVCVIEDIKEEKKNTLENNIQNLGNLSKNLDDIINKIKIISENLNQKKEELKLEMLNIFTKIRNILNERENELLLEIDKKFELFNFNDSIIKESEKLPKKVKSLLDIGKKVENELKNNNNININSIIINSINMENAIKQIKRLNESIKNFEDKNELKFKFVYEEEFEKIKEFVKKFGKIMKDSPFTSFNESSILNDNNLFINGLDHSLNYYIKNLEMEILMKLSINCVIIKVQL